jgi:hypothetical protein
MKGAIVANPHPDTNMSVAEYNGFICECFHVVNIEKVAKPITTFNKTITDISGATEAKKLKGNHKKKMTIKIDAG